MIKRWMYFYKINKILLLDKFKLNTINIFKQYVCYIERFQCV